MRRGCRAAAAMGWWLSGLWRWPGQEASDFGCVADFGDLQVQAVGLACCEVTQAQVAVQVPAVGDVNAVAPQVVERFVAR